LANILINSNTTDGIGNNVSTGGIFDMLDMSTDISFNGGIFKHAVASCIDGTILEYKVLGIAEKLLTSQVAIHKAHILRMPSQILTIEQ
jgi:hypothetical protein